ncbi:hypothetical protein GW17_00044966 [Ensete ventricosum]|nr:hypothetical protein GW17_00044966 [Ensete ventricosum]
MKEFLPVSNASCFLSLLILPKALDPVASRYNTLEDTLARANAWLVASQISGVPMDFMDVQTKALLTKISGETASATVNSGSLSDLSSLANASLYGFEDYHGVDIGVVKAVRLWYTPSAGELADTKLGFAISRTEEVCLNAFFFLSFFVVGTVVCSETYLEPHSSLQGFIYIASVDETDDEAAASTRSGLGDLFRQARDSSKLVVISRVSNEKVLPWMVSSAGAIRCFDTISLSQRLSLHRHALKPIRIHVLMWEQASTDELARCKPAAAPSVPFPPLAAELPKNLVADDASETWPGWDTAGDVSFRFNDIALS